MNKYSALPLLMAFSFLFGDANVQIRLQNGQIVQGEFVGTYMNHVHILVEEKIIYYACDDITSITYSAILRFDYDCSINTVTADILFPPELDPMTGEMTNMLPDVFNPDIPKPAVEKATSVIQNPAAEDFVIINGIKFPKPREPREWGTYEQLGYEQADEDIQNGEWDDVKGDYRAVGYFAIFHILALMPYFAAQKEVKMKMDNLLKDNKGHQKKKPGPQWPTLKKGKKRPNTGLNVNVDMMTDDEKTLYISGYEKRIKEMRTASITTGCLPLGGLLILGMLLSPVS